VEDDKTLLDYYTKNMTLHATITVAVVFGLFSLLAIISNTESLLTRAALTLAFIGLVVFGSYEINRYKHYGNVAKEKAEIFKAKEMPNGKGKMESMRKWTYETFHRLFERGELCFFVLMMWLVFFVWLGFLD